MQRLMQSQRLLGLLTQVMVQQCLLLMHHALIVPN